MLTRLALLTALLLTAAPAATAATVTAIPPGEFSGEAQVPPAPWCLCYKRPAAAWTEALPVGSGRMGAMVFGGVACERIQFNESTVWSGAPHSYAHAGAAGFLPDIRKLLFDGKQREAEDVAGREFMSIPLRQMAYQPCGDLYIDFPGHAAVADYRRMLDFDTALAEVS